MITVAMAVLAGMLAGACAGFYAGCVLARCGNGEDSAPGRVEPLPPIEPTPRPIKVGRTPTRMIRFDEEE